MCWRRRSPTRWPSPPGEGSLHPGPAGDLDRFHQEAALGQGGEDVAPSHRRGGHGARGDLLDVLGAVGSEPGQARRPGEALDGEPTGEPHRVLDGLPRPQFEQHHRGLALGQPAAVPARLPSQFGLLAVLGPVIHPPVGPALGLSAGLEFVLQDFQAVFQLGPFGRKQEFRGAPGQAQGTGIGGRLGHAQGGQLGTLRIGLVGVGGQVLLGPEVVQDRLLAVDAEPQAPVLPLLVPLLLGLRLLLLEGHRQAQALLDPADLALEVLLLLVVRGLLVLAGLLRDGARHPHEGPLQPHLVQDQGHEHRVPVLEAEIQVAQAVGPQGVEIHGMHHPAAPEHPDLPEAAHGRGAAGKGEDINNAAEVRHQVGAGLVDLAQHQHPHLAQLGDREVHRGAGEDLPDLALDRVPGLGQAQAGHRHRADLGHGHRTPAVHPERNLEGGAAVDAHLQLVADPQHVVLGDAAVGGAGAVLAGVEQVGGEPLRPLLPGLGEADLPVQALLLGQGPGLFLLGAGCLGLGLEGPGHDVLGRQRHALGRGRGRGQGRG